MHLYLLCFGLGVLVGVAGMVAFVALFFVLRLYAIDKEQELSVNQPIRLTSSETDLSLH